MLEFKCGNNAKAYDIKRRCGKCQENVKYVGRVRLQEIRYPIQTEVVDVNGMLTFNL